jgi:triosephosphate isomerase
MTKLVVANWKMNKNLTEVKSFFEEFNNEVFKHEAWIAPQFIHIENTVKLNKSAKKIGAQNCSHQLSGAFTGDISAASLKDIGVEFVLIGHSERRSIYGETDKICQQKIKLALSLNLTVIYCVGESLKERQDSLTFQVVENQLRQGLSDLGSYDPKNLIIAYEPVWAIGTGLNATKEQAQEVHAEIKKIVGNFKILYGGSVKPENVASYYSMPDIDGVLVGGASLKPKDFLALCRA